MGKVGPSSPYVTMEAAIVGKLKVMGKWGTEHSRKNAPFQAK